MSLQQTLAVAIFLGCYAAIASDKFDKTKVALFGAAVVLVLRVVDQHHAFSESVDWNTIFLLASMMVIVAIIRPTGLFDWIAIKSVKVAKGDPKKIMVLLAGTTALFSAFLDNVTTMLLIVPVTILIAETLQIDPVPLLICEILASNIGGTATLVGDPPNIMIASAARLSFMDFILNLTPVAIVIFAVFVLTALMVFKGSLLASEEQKAQVMEFREADAIRDPRLLKRCLVVFGLTVVGFVLHGYLHLQPATIALGGAALLLAISRGSAARALHDVEWSTLFFFLGLFIMVGALVEVGVIKIVSLQIVNVTRGNIALASMLVMWFSAGASAIVDNIPYVAAMCPLVKEFAYQLYPHVSDPASLLHRPEILTIWWSLALGACLGGNATLIGAMANVLVAGVAQRSGYPISFKRFLKYGIPFTLQSIVLSSIYVFFRYLWQL